MHFNFVQIDLSEVIDIHFVQPVNKGLGNKFIKICYSSSHEQPSKSSICSEFATCPHESLQINTDKYNSKSVFSQLHPSLSKSTCELQNTNKDYAHSKNRMTHYTPCHFMSLKIIPSDNKIMEVTSILHSH